MKKFERIDGSAQYKRNVEKANTGKYYEANPTEEVWANDKYIVHVRKDLEAMGQLMTHLSIRNNDNTAIRDWRDMQYIKNELVGEENEGFELFPKESRLVDTANQFHIWVFQSTQGGVPIGFTERVVTDLCEHPQHKHKLMTKGAKQRPFESDRKPHDNYKGFKKLLDAQKQFYGNEK